MLTAVTGADGFIGSHLTQDLVQAGYRVKAMAIYNSQGSGMAGWTPSAPRHPAARRGLQLGDVREPWSVRCTDAGRPDRLSPRRPDRDSVFVWAPRPMSRPISSARSTCWKACPLHRRPHCAHLDQRGVRHARRYAPIDEKHPLQASRPTRQQDRRRQAGREPLPVDRRGHSGRSTPTAPASRPGPSSRPSSARLRRGVREIRFWAICWPYPRLQLCDRYGAVAFRAVGEAGPAWALGQTLNAGSGQEITVGDTVLVLIAPRDGGGRGGDPGRPKAPAPRRQRSHAPAGRLHNSLTAATGWHSRRGSGRRPAPLTAEWFLPTPPIWPATASGSTRSDRVRVLAFADRPTRAGRAWLRVADGS